MISSAWEDSDDALSIMIFSVTGMKASFMTSDRGNIGAVGVEHGHCLCFACDKRRSHRTCGPCARPPVFGIDQWARRPTGRAAARANRAPGIRLQGSHLFLQPAPLAPPLAIRAAQLLHLSARSGQAPGQTAGSYERVNGSGLMASP